jgi:hypothetical protein
MKENSLILEKLMWEKPKLIVLDLALSEFNCIKLGEQADGEDINCPRS